MTDTGMYTFPPFHLDVANDVLWREATLVPLRPKTFAVLRYLMERAGQTVTRDEIFSVVWGTTKVGAQVLRASIRELRQALGDTIEEPRFIETVGQQGWRFIGTGVSGQSSVVSTEKENQKAKIFTPQSSILSPQHIVLVGREAELAQLHSWLAKARQGERQIVFVTGEAGIGKTALIDAFLSDVQRQEEKQKSKVSDPSSVTSPEPRAPVFIGWGQCVEHYGIGEPYMPVLAALEQLCRTRNEDFLLDLLWRYAPLWLAQMPSLLEPAARAELQCQLAGATRERMVRELAVLLEVLTAEHPLVLVLEDLHWADASTVELLAYVARRRETARLLVLGAYRPVEMLSVEHPLRHLLGELSAHQQCTELPLATLSETAVALYLDKRFSNSALPVRFAHLLYERTGGNPLFLVTVVEDLVTRELLKEMDGSWSLQLPLVDLSLGAPESLRHFLTEQMQRLPIEDRRVLEAGSVVGAEFSAAAAAAALAEAVADVEERCEHLARQRQFLRQAGISEWPDGTQAARYGFHHALYQQLWHERVTPTRRQQWHHRIGERLEEAYGQRTGEIAAELALHFEQGHDYKRAVMYQQYAGETALQRHAPREAITHLMRALHLLASLPEGTVRTQQELRLQVTLGPALIAAKGYAAPEVGEGYSRAQTLCQQLGEQSQLAPVLMGRWMFLLVRGELRAARELAEQLVTHAQHTQDSGLLAEAHWALGESALLLGEFLQARLCLEQGITFYDRQKHGVHAILYGQDPGVTCRLFAAWALWILGYPEQAYRRGQEALALARDLSQPNSEAFALIGGIIWLDQATGNAQTTQQGTEVVMNLAHEHGLFFWLAMAKIFQGWALAMQGRSDEGITQLHEGLAAYRATGAESDRPLFLTFLADACRAGTRTEEGFTAITEALTMIKQEKGNGLSEAELYRLKGELLLAQAGLRFQAEGFKEKTEEAAECFLKAIEIARKQQAKSLELRASTSLARLWQQQSLELRAGSSEQGAKSQEQEAQSKLKKAHRMLSAVYNWFTEGFDTKDLQEAKTLIEELGRMAKWGNGEKDKR